MKQLCNEYLLRISTMDWISILLDRTPFWQLHKRKTVLLYRYSTFMRGFFQWVATSSSFSKANNSKRTRLILCLTCLSRQNDSTYCIVKTTLISDWLRVQTPTFVAPIRLSLICIFPSDRNIVIVGENATSGVRSNKSRKDGSQGKKAKLWGVDFLLPNFCIHFSRNSEW